MAGEKYVGLIYQVVEVTRSVDPAEPSTYVLVGSSSACLDLRLVCRTSCVWLIGDQLKLIDTKMCPGERGPYGTVWMVDDRGLPVRHPHGWLRMESRARPGQAEAER